MLCSISLLLQKLVLGVVHCCKKKKNLLKLLALESGFVFGEKKKEAMGKKSKELLAKTWKCKKKLKQNTNNDTHHIV